MSDPPQPPSSSPPGGYGYPPPYGAAYGAWGYPDPVDRHIGWFVVTWVFFWPLALYSLLSAFLTIDRALAAGDVAGARYQADRVRRFGIIALCVGLAWIVVVLAFFIAVGASTAVHVCTVGSC